MTEFINPLERMRALADRRDRCIGKACVLAALTLYSFRIGAEEDLVAVTICGLVAALGSIGFGLEALEVVAEGRNMRDAIVEELMRPERIDS